MILQEQHHAHAGQQQDQDSQRDDPDGVSFPYIPPGEFGALLKGRGVQFAQYLFHRTVFGGHGEAMYACGARRGSIGFQHQQG